MIAALLLDEEAIERVLPILSPRDFFREQNRWVFEAAIELHLMGETITIPSIANWMLTAGTLDKAGGEFYLIDIAAKYFTAIGVETHARIVARCAYYVRLITAAAQVAQLAYEGPADWERVRKFSLELIDGVRTPADLAPPDGVRIPGLRRTP